MILLPAIFIVIATSLQNIKAPRLALALLIIAALATFYNFAYIHPYFSITRKQQFREVSEQVSQVECRNCIYFSDMTWYFDYYLKQFHVNSSSLDVYKLTEEKINGADSVWLLAGTHEFLTNPANPEMLTKKYYLSYEINGKYAFGRLYTKRKPVHIIRKNMIVE